MGNYIFSQPFGALVEARAELAAELAGSSGSPICAADEGGSEPTYSIGRRPVDLAPEGVR